MSLPAYKVRYSHKAKYLQVRMSTKGLEVVVPSKRPVSSSAIEQFVQTKKAWILRHWQRFLNSSEQAPTVPLELPTQVHLLAMQQTWEVVHLTMDSPKVIYVANQARQIKLLGNLTLPQEWISVLKEWLKKMAEQYLSAQLHLLAREQAMSFNELRFRHTTTRWGSCSTQKNISLCCNLLFLPPNLVQHVLLHELCHTKYMSHGVRFWQLLGRLDNDCESNRSALRTAGQYVPAWAK